MDDDGYLMDRKGKYILDDCGQMVALTEEHVAYLRSRDMYEEEEVYGLANG